VLKKQNIGYDKSKDIRRRHGIYSWEILLRLYIASQISNSNTKRKE
jgi:hypothetical protein